jgi:uncharacterized lipoprotein YmbA
MLHRQSIKVLAASTAALFVGACANRLAEHFYVVPSRVVDAGPVVDMRPIAIAAVEIPAVIDRPQLVVPMGENEVAVLETQRWAEPLSDGLTRVVIDELRSNRLPAYDAESLRLRKDALKIEIRVVELSSGVNSGGRLKVTWTVRDRSQDCMETGSIDAKLPAVSGYGAVPGAYADAMRRLAQAIVPSVRQAGTGCVKTNP